MEDGEVESDILALYPLAKLFIVLSKHYLFCHVYFYGFKLFIFFWWTFSKEKQFPFLFPIVGLYVSCLARPSVNHYTENGLHNASLELYSHQRSYVCHLYFVLSCHVCKIMHLNKTFLNEPTFCICSSPSKGHPYNRKKLGTHTTKSDVNIFRGLYSPLLTDLQGRFKIFGGPRQTECMSSRVQKVALL